MTISNFNTINKQFWEKDSTTQKYMHDIPNRGWIVVASIALGLVSFGIGGVALYCALADRAIKKGMPTASAATGKKADGVATATLQPQPSGTATPQTKNNEKQEIASFVKNFLKPYLDGTITPENDPQNRKSMMDELHEALPHLKSKNKTEERALRYYVRCALLGSLKKYSGKTKEWYVQTTADALKKAIPKDFPGKRLIFSDITELVHKEWAFFKKQILDK